MQTPIGESVASVFFSFFLFDLVKDDYGRIISFFLPLTGHVRELNVCRDVTVDLCIFLWQEYDMDKHNLIDFVFPEDKCYSD